jgi:hypothetical protein
MAQETLKITITADNQQAVKNIQETVTATNSLGTSFQKLPNTSNQATYALSNLSRVAQDAPYGFIGIANNLNPLLESFQKLSKDAGGAGGALKSMVAGLTGPAGIGIALGVVSSLIVAFGDEIGSFITEKMQGLGKAFTVESSLIKESSSAFVKASTDIDKLKNSFELFQQGSITKDKFLKEFNSTLGDTIAKTNDLATAEKFLTDYADTYIEMTFKKAIATEASAQAAKKLLELEISKGTPLTAGIGTALTAMFGNPAMIGIKAAESKLAIHDGLQAQIDLLKNFRKQYDDEANQLQKSLTNTFGTSDITKPKPKADKTLSLKEAQNLIRQINNTNNLLTPLEDVIGGDTAIKDLEKQHQDYLTWLTGWTKYKENLAQKNIAKEKNDLKDLTKEYEQFANTISSTVTSALFDMFNAMQQGESSTQALGDMFNRLLQQMAAMVVQAAIFSGIMSLLPGGSIASGGKGFFGIFKNLLGLADGGIATGPTLAMIGEGSESEAVLPLSKLGNIMQSSFNAGSMNGTSVGQNGQFVLRGQDLVLAMQRSNSALNLRRGV